MEVGRNVNDLLADAANPDETPLGDLSVSSGLLMGEEEVATRVVSPSQGSPRDPLQGSTPGSPQDPAGNVTVATNRDVSEALRLEREAVHVRFEGGKGSCSHSASTKQSSSSDSPSVVEALIQAGPQARPQARAQAGPPKTDRDRRAERRDSEKAGEEDQSVQHGQRRRSRTAGTSSDRAPPGATGSDLEFSEELGGRFFTCNPQYTNEDEQITIGRGSLVYYMPNKDDQTGKKGKVVIVGGGDCKGKPPIPKPYDDEVKAANKVTGRNAPMVLSLQYSHGSMGKPSVIKGDAHMGERVVEQASHHVLAVEAERHAHPSFFALKNFPVFSDPEYAQTRDSVPCTEGSKQLRVIFYECATLEDVGDTGVKKVTSGGIPDKYIVTYVGDGSQRNLLEEILGKYCKGNPDEIVRLRDPYDKLPLVCLQVLDGDLHNIRLKAATASKDRTTALLMDGDLTKEDLIEIADRWCAFNEEHFNLDTHGLDWWAFLQCLLGLVGGAFDKLLDCRQFTWDYNRFVSSQVALKPKVVNGFATEGLVDFLAPFAFEAIPKLMGQAGKEMPISKWADTPEGKDPASQRARIWKAVNYFVSVTDEVDRRVSKATIKRHQEQIEALISQNNELLQLRRDVKNDNEAKQEGVTIMMEPYIADDGRNTMMDSCAEAVKEAMTDNDAVRDWVNSIRADDGALDELVDKYIKKMPVPTGMEEAVDREVYADTVAAGIKIEVNAVVLKEVEEEQKKKEAQLERKRKALDLARQRAEQAKQRAVTRREAKEGRPPAKRLRSGDPQSP